MPGTGMNRARNDDVDPHARGLPKAPQRSGIAVAQHRFGSAREDGGHAVPVCAQLPMAHGVDADVDKLQAAIARSAFDGSGSEAESAKLPKRNDPVLPLGKLGNRSI